MSFKFPLQKKSRNSGSAALPSKGRQITKGSAFGIANDFLKKHPKKVLLAAVLLTAYYFCLPHTLFQKPTATVVESREGSLLGAGIADDGQWRFPVADSVPFKFKHCILEFEDTYFYLHPGFNPVAMAKALGANLKAGRTVRGGSTLSQQLIRLSRQRKGRSYWEKLLELVLSTRLELRYSKEEILELYASHAPYGGNVVGLEMAAWRYFGLKPQQLSWAEAATLAVLPNAPGLIYPGKNQRQLLLKRNALLKRLRAKETIDETTYRLSLLEQLPERPFPMPRIAPHLVARLNRTRKGKRVVTTIDKELQLNVNAIVDRHYRDLKQNQVHNVAVLVMDVDSREVRAYVGNADTDRNHQKDVDMVRANRSTGSILKPLLYTAMLDAGELLPEMLVPDVPTQIAGYTPENFDGGHSGAVQAKSALARSLNIPAVRLLQSYGLEKFRDQLNFFKLGGIDRSADHYGLTLILGGAESNLWDLCKTYASLVSTVNHFNRTSGEYYTKEFIAPILERDGEPDFGKPGTEKTFWDAGSIYLTLEAMKEVNRPQGNESWEFYDSSKEIAWKTGTSFGNKDAWAIGVTATQVVGVWVGNADGEGRPNNTGVGTAAPILFDVFDVLPETPWIQKPLDAFAPMEVCAQSGYLAKDICPKITMDIPNKKNYVGECKYHRSVQLDAQKQFRVNASCIDLNTAVTESWFVLPPLMEFYFKKEHPEYRSLPPYAEGCENEGMREMEFIQPRDGSRISLTKNFEGNLNEMVFKLVHSKPGTKVFWYLNERYLMQTNEFHEIGLVPELGRHRLTVMDERGNTLSVQFTVY
ncbi:MAG: penicillin-binding protein 1C [Sediminicola sp.]